MTYELQPAISESEDDSVRLAMHYERINIFEITRGACRKLIGPCPHGSCRFNLLNEKKGRDGSEQDDSAPRDLSEPCVLALAERGGMTLDEIAKRLGLTRERVRQIEMSLLLKLRNRLSVD